MTHPSLLAASLAAPTRRITWAAPTLHPWTRAHVHGAVEADVGWATAEAASHKLK